MITVVQTQAQTMTEATHPADNLSWREAQRERLDDLRVQLIAEGADPARYATELSERAEAWPE